MREDIIQYTNIELVWCSVLINNTPFIQLYTVASEHIPDVFPGVLQLPMLTLAIKCNHSNTHWRQCIELDKCGRVYNYLSHVENTNPLMLN